MTWIVVLVLIAIGLVSSPLFSGAETGFYCVSPLRVHLGVREKDARAGRLARFLEDRQSAVGMTLVGTNLMNYVATTALAFLFADLLGFTEHDTEFYTIVILTPVVFVFGEVVPKSIFQQYPYVLLLRYSWWLSGAYRALQVTGVLLCHRRITSLIAYLVGATSIDRGAFDPKRRMASLLQEALAGQRLGDDRSYLIEQVVQLSETPLHAVMIPRNRVVAIAGGADRRELARLARRTPYSTLPVYDKHPRHIIGVIRVDELLRSSEWSTIGECVEPVTTLSAHVTVATASSHMQGTGQDMIVVTDRGGLLLGVVTFKNLFDTVLGELVTTV